MTTIEIAIVAGVLLAGGVFFLDWRKGVVGTIAVGLLLDPLRKLVPGEPIYVNALVVVPMGLALLGAWRAGAQFSPRKILRPTRALLVPSLLFLALVAIQSVHALARTGSLAIAAIGVLAYLSPLPGLLVGYNYAVGTADLTHFFKTYVVMIAVMATGIVLVVAGFDHRVLEPVGEALMVYSSVATRLESGFFRAPEVAAWHAATASCFVLLLAFTRRRSRLVPYLLLSLVPYLLTAIVFTGRRKGILVVLLFLAFFFAFVLLARRGASKVVALIVPGVLLVTGLFFVAEFGQELDVRRYFSRGGSLQGGISIQRFEDSLVGSLRWVIASNGVWGSGAGTGSQGAQHFGGMLTGAAAEGGVAKIVAELGVPGLVLLVWLVGAAFYHGLALYLSVGRRGGTRRARYVYGSIAFLFAEAMIFVIGHQVFGDPLVLFVIGVIGGFALAGPKMIEGRVIVDRSSPRALRVRRAQPTILEGAPRS